MYKQSGWANPPGPDFCSGNRWCNISPFECLRSCWSLCSGTRWGHPVFHSIKLVWDHLAPTSLSMDSEQHSFFCLVQTSRLVWDVRGCEGCQDVLNRCVSVSVSFSLSLPPSLALSLSLCVPLKITANLRITYHKVRIYPLICKWDSIPMKSALSWLIASS